MEKEENRCKRLKPSVQKQTKLLENFLEGNALNEDQLKKKQLLEATLCSTCRDSEKMTISQYLHEAGFSYESQAAMVGVKGVSSYVINYLVALFLNHSENPLNNDRLDREILKRITNKWGSIKDILKETGLEITAEKAILSLLKNFGNAQEGLAIFLDLFEENLERNEERRYPKCENLEYPFGKKAFMKNVLEIGRGGHTSLLGFIQTFIKSPEKNISEWELINNCLWDNFEVEKKQFWLEGGELRYDGIDWKIVADNGLDSKIRRLTLISKENSRIKKVLCIDGENEKVFFLKEDKRTETCEKTKILVKDSNVSELKILNHLIRCLKTNGGTKNKQAFIDCLSKKELGLGQRRQSLYAFFRSESGGSLSVYEAMSIIVNCIKHNGGSKNKLALVECLSESAMSLGGKVVSLFEFLCLPEGGGLSAFDALQIIIRCVGNDGGTKNKQAFLECLTKLEINLNGKMVSIYCFFCSKEGGGLSPSDALHAILKVVGQNGGSQSKQALTECLTKPEIDLDGRMVPLYEFLTSQRGGWLSGFEAIQVLMRCLSYGGSLKNKKAFLDCLSDPKIKLNGKNVSLCAFMSSEKGVGLSLTEVINIIVSCISHKGGNANKSVLMACFCDKDISLDGQKVTLFTFLSSKLGGDLSVTKAMNIIVKCIGHTGGKQNKQSLMECLINRDLNLDGQKVTVFNFMVSEKGGGLCASKAINLMIKCIGQDAGSKNKQALLECLNKPELLLDGKMVSIYKFLRSKKRGGLSAYKAIYLITKCVGHSGGLKNKQSFIECFNREDLWLDGKRVSFYTFLVSERGGNLSPTDAIQILEKCIGESGGSKNKKSFIECFWKKVVFLNGENVSVYTFLCSKQGGGLPPSEAIHVLAKCVGSEGGSKNMQSFIDCLIKPDLNLGSKKVSVYTFLCSEEGGGLSRSDVIYVIVKCIGHGGGTQNKVAFLECFNRADLNLGEKEIGLYAFLNSEEGGGMCASEAMQVIARSIGQESGSRNKQAFIEALRKPEINLNGKMVSLYTFLRSKQGGGLNTSEAIQFIVRCIGHGGGLKNKQALIACLCKPELALGGKLVTFYTFLISRYGCELSVSKAMHVIIKCIGLIGGSKNKQALIECFIKAEIDLEGRAVPLFYFLVSESGGKLSPAEAIHLLAKCIGENGGSKNKQAMVGFFCDIEIDLDRKKVSLYTYLCSKKGLGLSVNLVVELIGKCVGTEGGCKNKEALKECFTREDLKIDGKKVSIYTFLSSKKGGGVSPSETIHILSKCIGQAGGYENKQSLIDCFNKDEVDLNGKKVSLYNFLISRNGGRLSVSVAIHLIVKCIGHGAGYKNKQALVECFCEKDIDLDGEMVSLYRFLCSKEGGVATSCQAIQVIVKCMSYRGGSNSKQSLIDCLSLDELDLHGKKMSLYQFLLSELGAGLGRLEALHVISRCIGRIGGTKNKQLLIECFKPKFLEVDSCKLSLFEIFLSGSMTKKEAFYLCLIFSLNRYSLNIKDVLSLFALDKNNGQGETVVSVLKNLKISCYTTIINLITKILNYSNISTESKRTLFELNCQSLMNMFVNGGGFFVQKIKEHPDWSTTVLGERCVRACVLYKGRDIHYDLWEREKRIIEWFSQFEKGYKLTGISLDVIIHVQSLEDLNSLLKFCDREIEKRGGTTIDADWCENLLKALLKISIEFTSSTIQAILKYESSLLNWFSLKEICIVLEGWRNNVKIDESIHYFFENRKDIQLLIPDIEPKKSFLLYMGLSSVLSHASLPLKVESIQQFLQTVNEGGGGYFLKKTKNLYPIYSIYSKITHQERKDDFHRIVKGIPQLFGSFDHFQNTYQHKIRKKEWTILSGLMDKWDLNEDNLTQEELFFLIRIQYQLPKEIAMSWSDFYNLKNYERGCCILNQTRHPRWVFVLAFLEKVRSNLECEYFVDVHNGYIHFKSFTDMVGKNDMFPLFKLRLHKDGVIFEGENVDTVECFYAQSGIKKYIYSSQDPLGTDQEMQYEEQGSKGLGETFNVDRKLKTGSLKRGWDYAELSKYKQEKMVTRDKVLKLYEAVSGREFLTERNCQIFMQGACYLSESMIDFLLKKRLVIEVGNLEIREKWYEFKETYLKKRESPNIQNEWDFPFIGGNLREEMSLLSFINDNLETVLPEFGQEDIDGFEDVCDLWSQNFEYDWIGTI